MTQPIRIIGGGMMGMTLALRLAQRGLPVVVHEREPSPGGLSGVSSLGGIPVERFYHCVLPTDTALISLLEEIGLGEVLQWNRTRTGFFHKGRLIEMTTTADFLKFPAITLIDRLRLGWTIAYCGRSKDWRRFDREPISRFLRRHGGHRLFETIWEPLLLAKLGNEYDLFPASFIWATITRMLSARKAKDRSEKIGFVKGRYGQVFVALGAAIQNAGGEVMTSSEVASVVRSSGLETCWNVFVNGKPLPAAAVILCTPAPVAATLLGESVPDAADALRQIEYLGVVCEVLLLKRSLTPYYVLNLTDRGLPFTGVIEFTNLAGTSEFDGYSVIYLPRYSSSSSTAWDKSDDTIHRENLNGLVRIIPDFSMQDVVAWDVMRAKNVQPIHRAQQGNTSPPVSLAPGLLYLSATQMHPWPVFNDRVVSHVDASLSEVLGHSAVTQNPLGIQRDNP